MSLPDAILIVGAGILGYFAVMAVLEWIERRR